MLAAGTDAGLLGRAIIVRRLGGLSQYVIAHFLSGLRTGRGWDLGWAGVPSPIPPWRGRDGTQNGWNVERYGGRGVPAGLALKLSAQPAVRTGGSVLSDWFAGVSLYISRPAWRSLGAFLDFLWSEPESLYISTYIQA